MPAQGHDLADKKLPTLTSARSCPVSCYVMPLLACATQLYTATEDGISDTLLASTDLSSPPLLPLLSTVRLFRVLPKLYALPALAGTVLSEHT